MTSLMMIKFVMYLVIDQS